MITLTLDATTESITIEDTSNSMELSLGEDIDTSQRAGWASGKVSIYKVTFKGLNFILIDKDGEKFETQIIGMVVDA